MGIPPSLVQIDVKKKGMQGGKFKFPNTAEERNRIGITIKWNNIKSSSFLSGIIF